MAGLLDFLRGNQSPLEALRDGGNPAPGAIKRGPNGESYQYAETRGMQGATGDQGWIPVNPAGGGMRDRLRDLAPLIMMMDPLGRNQAAAAMIMRQQDGRKRDAKNSQYQNQTREWLLGQGVDAGQADYLVSDPDALRQWFGQRNKGTEPNWQLQTIYENGNERKVLMDMNNPDPGNYKPVGDVKTNLMTPEEIAQKKDIAAAGKTDVRIDNGKLTEQQSKDVGFYSRGKYALDELGAIDDELTSSTGYLASQGGVLGNKFKDTQYQLAEGAGRDFLSIILRKDTGAAVTPQEFELYGKVYLPWPGDDKKTVEAKRKRRERALMGIRRGLGTASPLADDIDRQFDEEKAAQPQEPAAPAGPPTPQTQAEFDALPPGTTYIDPDDGKQYRKP